MASLKIRDEDTIRLRLTKADLTFICESMSENVPCSADMTPEELETYNKCVSAKLKIAKVM